MPDSKSLGDLSVRFERPSPSVDGGVSCADYFSQRPKATDELSTYAVTPLTKRAIALFVIRESDEWDAELFNAMREQTYQNMREIPEVDAIRQVGLAPLKNSTFVVKQRNADGSYSETTVVVEVLQEGNTQAFLFNYRGFWHLWSMASAWKAEPSHDDQRLNAFTTILIDVILRLRPISIYAAHLSRLVRSTSQGNRLQAVMDGNVDHLWVKDMRFDFVGPQGQMGFMLLSMMSWVVALERDAIVSRLLAGRIAKWRRGEWPFGDSTVPFGFKLENRKLVPDPTKRQQVREMMIVLSSEAGPAEKVAALAELGVTTMRPHRRLKKRASIATLASKDYAIRSLMAWASLWISGEYLWRVTNSFRDLDELSGVPILRRKVDGKDDLSDNGELQMLYQVGLPDGGWAEEGVVRAFETAAVEFSANLLKTGSTPNRPVSPTVIDTSINPLLLNRVLSPDHIKGMDRSTAARRTSSRAKRTISPMTGRGWREGDFYYELQMTAAGTYRLVRWVMTDDEDGSIGKDVLRLDAQEEDL